MKWIEDKHNPPNTTRYRFIRSPRLARIKEIDDRHGGSILQIEKVTICGSCGGLATSAMTYVWKGTKDPNLESLHYGASIKHKWTSCTECGALSGS